MDHGNGHRDGGHAGQGGHITREALFFAGLGTHQGGHVSFAYHGGNGDGGSHAQLAGKDAISPQGQSIIEVHVPTKTKDGDAIRGYICHISRHGRIDILSEFKKLSAKFDLIQIDGRRPGLDVSNQIFYKILDFDAYAHAQELSTGRPFDAATHGDRAKPNGWYPGATGTTTLIRQYWQVGKRTSLFGMPVFDDKAGTYLEVEVITWSYYETGDFETKLEVRVISAPEWSDREQKWGYRSAPFDSHQRVAIKSYIAMMDLLIATAPSLAASLLRAELDAKYPPQAEVPEGTFAMTAAEILERESQDVAQDAKDDQVARDNNPATAPATPEDDGTSTATSDLEVELED
jgi:hypothetical protein